MQRVDSPTSRDLLAARQVSKASVAFGAVLSVLGVFAVLSPLFTGIATTVLVGMLLAASGIVEIAFVFKAESFGKGILRFLLGGLSILGGAVCLATPAASLGALTIMLGVLFLAGGVTDIVLALRLRSEEGWGWTLFSGLVSIALGAMIISQWPVSGVWAVGLYVGIRVLTHGWMLMALGRTGQETLTYLQDTRIEMLERHVRAGARALQETQAALADHSAMLLALDNEVRKKVSSSEVDPAFRELNEKLSAARESMRRAADATAAAWDSAQTQANTAFDSLRRSSAEMAERLKRELGLSATDSSPSGA